MKLQIWGEHIETIAIKFCKLMINMEYITIYSRISTCFPHLFLKLSATSRNV